ncbi:hypothetical protein [Rhodococcus sp. CX]|uniref:hypothetical protein n=1 Tax=Rhodococcus sp. CX TaxID=2789880 RepID=UPI001E52F6B8|nr:hypothetical protein [Rhodococcus sp. CX]
MEKPFGAVSPSLAVSLIITAQPRPNICATGPSAENSDGSVWLPPVHWVLGMQFGPRLSLASE